MPTLPRPRRATHRSSKESKQKTDEVPVIHPSAPSIPLTVKVEEMRTALNPRLDLQSSSYEKDQSTALLEVGAPSSILTATIHAAPLLFNQHLPGQKSSNELWNHKPSLNRSCRTSPNEVRIKTYWVMLLDRVPSLHA